MRASLSDFSRREIPFSQLGAPMSNEAQAGVVGRGLGALPQRAHHIPQRLPLNPASIRWVHPLPSQHHPWPRPPASA